MIESHGIHPLSQETIGCARGEIRAGVLRSLGEAEQIASAGFSPHRRNTKVPVGLHYEITYDSLSNRYSSFLCAGFAGSGFIFHKL